MGVLDKVLFWKKGDDLGLGELGDLGNLPGADATQQFDDPLSAPPQPSQPFGQQQSFSPQQFAAPQSFAQQAPQSYQQPNRDLDLVAAKLDALRASLDSINQRLANLERIAQGEEGYDDYARRRGW